MKVLTGPAQPRPSRYVPPVPGRPSPSAEMLLELLKVRFILDGAEDIQWGQLA